MALPISTGHSGQQMVKPMTNGTWMPVNGNYTNDPFSSMNVVTPKDHVKNLRAKIASEESMIKALQTELDRYLQNMPVGEGPTLRELEQYPALQNAWEEYSSIRKLLGLKD